MKRRSLPFLPKPNLLKTFFAFFFLLALSTVSFASNEDPASPDYDGGKKNLLRKALPLSVSAVMAEAAIEFRGNVVNFAAAHEGIPYVLGGYSTNGFDCSGFMRYVLDYYDIPVTTTANQQAQKGQRMPIEMARPGDLVFFGSANFMTHVAMVYSNLLTYMAPFI